MIDDDKFGIYKIVNISNNKLYIGSTSISFKCRWSHHLSSLKYNRHPNQYLQNSYNKYGIEGFVFEILEIIDDYKMLAKREIYWILELKSSITENGYNIILGERENFKFPDEVRKKISKSLTGKKHTDETKKKLSLFHKGRKLSSEHCKNISESLKGHTYTEDTKRKMSLSAKKRDMTEFGRTYGGLNARYWIVVYPNKNKELVYSLNTFCVRNNLNHGNMYAVANKRIKE